MTIAQQLKITEFPFEIRNSKGNKIYSEDSDKYWYKQEFDPKGNETYHENSDKFWEKTEYDSNNNVTYYENSNGEIRDNRPKSVPEYTMGELAQMLGKQFKIKE